MKQWFALYTKPRWEKKINATLLKKGIETWCPLQKVERQWSDRIKIIDDPIFKSYVFVHIDETERVKVLQTEGIVNFVYYLSKPAVISDKEIELIKTYLSQQNTIVSVCSIDCLEKNMQIRIKQGVFMGQQGIVINKSGKRRVLVHLQTLGKVMVAEFSIDHVEHV